MNSMRYIGDAFVLTLLSLELIYRQVGRIAYRKNNIGIQVRRQNMALPAQNSKNRYQQVCKSVMQSKKERATTATKSILVLNLLDRISTRSYPVTILQFLT